MEHYGIIELFPKEDRQLWQSVAELENDIWEIRMRADKPVILNIRGQESYLGRDGGIAEQPGQAHRCSISEIQRLVLHNCEYSLYAFEEEIRQGFLSVKGGHRIGLTGQAVPEGDKGIKALKNISGVNIRVSHEILGAGDRVLPHMYRNGRVCNTLLVSPPGCGKTTLLRDLVRQISDGNPYGKGLNVGVVDERGEIAGCHMGIPQNDVGIRTDVLDACPKSLGVPLLIRSMAPDVLAVDEIGTQQDLQMLQYAATCGIQLLATIHGSSFEDLFQKETLFKGSPQESMLFRCFDLFVLLHRENGVCRVKKYVDKEEAYEQIAGSHLYFSGLRRAGTLV